MPRPEGSRPERAWLAAAPEAASSPAPRLASGEMPTLFRNPLGDLSVPAPDPARGRTAGAPGGRALEAVEKL